MTIRDDIRALKYRQIKWALEQANGNIRRAARCLGANPNTIGRWMRETGLVAYARTLRRKHQWWLASALVEGIVFAAVILLSGCGAIPNRPLQDRCYVYVESEDICVQRGGAVVRDWSAKHEWDDNRMRVFYVYVSASDEAFRWGDETLPAKTINYTAIAVEGHK